MRWLTFAIILTLNTSSFSYQTVQIHGWNVLIHEDYSQPEHRVLSLQVRRIIEMQLRESKRVLPVRAYQLLSKTKIWVEYKANPSCRGNSGVYRTGTPYILLQRGLHPFKSNSIEICGAKIFYDTVHTMPAQILHELAHAYHAHAVTPEQDKLIQKTYLFAKKRGLYKRVKMYEAAPQVAYAQINYREYFAESTESFFGKNNAYPFNRQQLKQYDPKAYKMIQTIWRVKKTPPPYGIDYGYRSYYKNFKPVSPEKWK